MPPDVIDLAARQHGVVARRQLLESGCHRSTVDRWLASGRLRSVALGVFAVAGSAPTAMQQLMVAALRCGEGARVVGPAVLAALGMFDVPTDPRFAVLVPPHRRVRGVDHLVRRTDVDVLGRLAVVDGLPSVSLARQVLESAVWWDPAPLVDQLRWRRPQDVERLGRLVALAGRHAGAVRLRRAGLLEPAAPESAPERRTVALLAHHDPETQVWVLPDLRVDVLLRRPGIVLECQGSGHAGPSGRAADRDRFARVEALGMLVVPVTAADLRDAEAFVARIDRLVATRTTLADPRHA